MRTRTCWSSRPRPKPGVRHLDKKIDAKCPKLTEAEIKTLVADDKWMALLSSTVQGELERVAQTLTGRIRELAERSATPLPELTDEVATFAARVEEHLAKMGASWKCRGGFQTCPYETPRTAGNHPLSGNSKPPHSLTMPSAITYTSSGE